MKWKLYTQNENIRPPVAGFEPKEHDSEEDALKEACHLMATQLHRKIIYIERPNGEQICSAEIEAWCKGRQSKTA